MVGGENVGHLKSLHKFLSTPDKFGGTRSQPLKKAVSFDVSAEGLLGTSKRPNGQQWLVSNG
jgi:hypothetical protein